MKKESGITLIALVVTVIVMIILASISIYQGKGLISTSRVQTLQTNMLTIQAKVKAYSEEIESKVWVLEEGSATNQKDGKRKELFHNKGLEQSETNPLEYIVTDSGLENMGLGDLKKENENKNFKVIYDNEYKNIDLEYVPGVQYENNTYYKLSELKTLFDTE